MLCVVAVMVALFAPITAQSNQDNPRYPALVAACLADWKGCLGNSATGLDEDKCDACLDSCGQQAISTPPDGTLCTQLQDHCGILLFDTPPGPTCQSPTCVSYYDKCLLEGPSSPACGYCGSACKSCPLLYKACVGSEPPAVAPGTCPNEGCTYYAKQCKRSPGIGTRFCGDCTAACIGVKDCEKVFDSCDRLNV